MALKAPSNTAGGLGSLLVPYRVQGRALVGVLGAKPPEGARSKFWGVSGSEDRGCSDSSIQFINSGMMGDKSFKEWRQKWAGVEGWVTAIF